MNPTSGVLGEAWSLYKRHWRHLLTVAFVVYAGVAIVNAILVATLTWLGGLIAFFLTIVALFWVQGALVTAVEDIRDGRADLSVGDTFRRVQPRLGAIIAASLVAILLLFVGFLLLVVPGLILMTWFSVLIPVVVLERVGAFAALGRSRALVRGYGLQVFMLILLTILILLAFEIVLAIVLSPVADWLQGLVGNVVSSTLTAPFVAIAWTLLYHRLNRVHEGSAPDGQGLAAA